MLESLFNKVLKKTTSQVFFCEYCEIFKKIFFYRTPPVDASENLVYLLVQNKLKQHRPEVSKCPWK